MTLLPLPLFLGKKVKSVILGSPLNGLWFRHINKNRLPTYTLIMWFWFFLWSYRSACLYELIHIKKVAKQYSDLKLIKFCFAQRNSTLLYFYSIYTKQEFKLYNHLGCGDLIRHMKDMIDNLLIHFQILALLNLYGYGSSSAMTPGYET